MHLVLGGVVDAEFVLHRGLEQQIGVEGLVELYIVVYVGKAVYIAVAALVPVGRHICLRELQRRRERAYPVALLHFSLHSCLHLVGSGKFLYLDGVVLGIHYGMVALWEPPAAG